MKPFRIRIEVDITARDREEAERRAGLLYSDLGHWPQAVGRGNSAGRHRGSPPD